MSTLQFYRTQATLQQTAADAATLDRVRDRCQEAADSWAAFADKLEKRIALRHKLADARTLANPGESPGGGRATA